MTLPVKDNLLHLGMASPLVNELERQVAPLSNPNITQPNIIIETAADGLVATGNNQATALQITAQTSRFTTVAAGAGAMLPASVPGMEITIINHGAATLQVYTSTATIDAGATINDIAGASGVPVMVNSTVLFWCTSQGLWYTEGLATGFTATGSGSFQTFSSIDGLVAKAGGGQGGATPITAMQNLFSTVVTAGDSAILPPSKLGMQVDVVNKTATSMNVFPAVGEQINGLAANTAIAVAGGSVTLFFCGTAGQWWTK